MHAPGQSSRKGISFNQQGIARFVRIPRGVSAVRFRFQRSLSDTPRITRKGGPSVPLISPSADFDQRSATPVLDRAQGHSLALAAGFREAGVVALPAASGEAVADRYARWIADGRAGTMDYLKRTDEQGRFLRSRVSIPFPWARSAIVCFASYHSARPKSTDPAEKAAGWVARYAWSSRVHPDGVRRPSDYHKVLKKRLSQLEAGLHQELGEFEARGYVDTGPVVERALATAAGLGWTGKNTCLIHPRLGSYGFLAVLLTSLPTQPDSPPLTVPDRCGSCRRCLDACPTGALDAPYQMDAARCIAYLTIEHRSPFADELREAVGAHLFGCDDCQTACPFNHSSRARAPEATRSFEPHARWSETEVVDLLSMDDVAWRAVSEGSPLHRATADGLARNAAIVLGNTGEGDEARRALEEAARAHPSATVREAASWGVDRLARRAGGA